MYSILGLLLITIDLCHNSKVIIIFNCHRGKLYHVSDQIRFICVCIVSRTLSISHTLEVGLVIHICVEQVQLPLSGPGGVTVCQKLVGNEKDSSLQYKGQGRRSSCPITTAFNNYLTPVSSLKQIDLWRYQIFTT